jgi:DNA repair exonuclease SbcCD nuclease subunit
MRFRFVHAADLHLDTPFSGLAQVSEEAASLLRDASIKAFASVVDLAVERQAEFVVLGGDLYDGEQRGVRAQIAFLRGVERLARHGIKTFVVHGNHDPLGGWSAVRSWPAEVTIFGSDEVSAVQVESDGRVLATVFGLSYGRREVSENLVLRFPRAGDLVAAQGRLADGGLNIGLLHCSVGDQPEHSSYSPCSLADLAGTQMDYWALGHIHRAQILRRGEPWVVYPGNTQGRSPKPAELGPKGAMVVEVEDSRVARVDFFPTDAVRFVSLDVDVSSLDRDADVGSLRQELLARAAGAREENPGCALLARVSVRGRGPLHHDLVAPCACEDLLRDLRDEFTGERPFFWWESLRDHSRPEVDLDVIRARDDFSSSVLALSETMAHDPDARGRLARELSPTAPVGLSRNTEPLGEGDVPDLLEDARALALELLEEEAGSCE